MKNQICLIEHERLISRGLRCLVGENGEMSIREINPLANIEAQLEESNPSMVIIDVDLPDMNAFTLAERITKVYPVCKIIFLARSVSNLLATNIIQAKADGFLLKTDSFEIIQEALNQIASGNVSYSHSMQNLLVYDPQAKTYRLASEQQGAVLTNRQIEVLRYLAWGHSVKQIAKIMHLSEKSVDSHKYRIMNRLGIHDRVKLALFAIREQIIDPWTATESL